MDESEAIAELCWTFDEKCRDVADLDVRAFLIERGVDLGADRLADGLVLELLRCAAGHWELDQLVRAATDYLAGAIDLADQIAVVVREFYANRLSGDVAPAWQTFAGIGYDADRLRLKLDDELLWLGQLVGGRWTIWRRIGDGGFGVVYEAREFGTQASVAVKAPRQRSGYGVELLRNEANALLRLDHPHVLRVREAVEWDGVPILVTDYVPGGTLRGRMAQGRMPLPVVLRIACEVAAALQHANSRRLYHRDLKPDNVLLDAEDRAILADFGLVVGRDKSWQGRAVDGGTQPYMDFGSHVGLTDQVDARTDVFALGALLLEMLTGVAASRPQASREEAVVDSILIGTISPPFPEDVPPSLRSITLRCLASEPDRRYACPRDVQIALESIHEPCDTMSTPTEPQDVRCAAEQPGP